MHRNTSTCRKSGKTRHLDAPKFIDLPKKRQNPASRCTCSAIKMQSRRRLLQSASRCTFHGGIAHLDVPKCIEMYVFPSFCTSRCQGRRPSHINHNENITYHTSHITHHTSHITHNIVPHITHIIHITHPTPPHTIHTTYITHPTHHHENERHKNSGHRTRIRRSSARTTFLYPVSYDGLRYERLSRRSHNEGTR